MTLPAGLRQIIDQALLAVRRDPNHDLQLGYRQAIWAAFGPKVGDGGTGGEVGHRRRTRLAILAGQHVIPIWRSAFPGDTTAEQSLAESENVLKGKMNQEAALRHYDQFWSYLDGLAHKTTDMAITVGYAAVQALGVAIQDEIFDSDKINYDTMNIEDMESIDAAYFAASAYAGGPAWETVAGRSGDSGRREQFWVWWLTEAAQAAWVAGS
jgi:hypothetical protein